MMRQKGVGQAATGPRIVGAAAAGMVAMALAAACAGGGPAARQQADGRPATVERLAAAAGCDPSMQAEHGDLREATCLTARGSYVMATFRHGTGMSGWVNASRGSGRSLLIGSDWAVAGPVPALRSVQQRLGGRVSQE